MKTKTAIKLAFITALLTTAASAQEFMMRAPTPAETDDVYFLAQLKVEDFPTFQAEYGAGAAALLDKSNVELLAATPTHQLLEGEWDSNWTVLLRFEDQADFESFYNSDAYQNVFIPVRQSVTSVNNVVAIPAFDPANLGG